MYLEIQNVSKKIKEDFVLHNINLSMERGKIYGLQGKNGCGKSMLMRVISGLVLPTEGNVIINGEELGQDMSFPRSIGVFIEKPGFLDSYSGFQNLKMLAAIRNQITDDDIKRVLVKVGLEETMHKKYRKYSLGMKQKLGIAAAIMERPDIVILDEPANALDEASEQNMWQLVKEERDRGALVIISCHTDDILQHVSDEIYKMDRGEIKTHIIL